MRKTSKILDPKWEDIFDRDDMIVYLCKKIDRAIKISVESILSPEEVMKLEKAAARARKAL